MKGKTIQLAILLIVVLTAFWALYLTEPFKSRLGHPEEKKKEIPPTFSLPSIRGKPVIVGIIGEGNSAIESGNLFNHTVVRNLVQGIEKNGAAAIFLNGNIVSAVEIGQNMKAKPISSEALENQLAEVTAALKEAQSNPVPLFPTMGDKEIAVAGSSKAFQKLFHLDGALVEDYGLAYTVSIGPAFFAVVPTDSLDGEKQASGTSSTAGVLPWLDEVLESAAKHHQYLFVIGFEPAYPTTATFQAAPLAFRDQFWTILAKRHVLGYFSSREQLFDRSNRNGVWQIISGSGGAVSNGKESKYPFVHALILTVPNGEEDAKLPTLKIIDESGEVIDSFELSPHGQPLHQMRIS